ncbi:dihydroorotase family protein [Pyramidobacter piscolens]|uniref:dihydroorotase n=1 Tax=Pyramidobacter piscolens TaxID=638849 RepID=UPI0026DEF3E1|nr:dihydroorotase family protein [Pyramidobacter piscolens]
MVKVDLVVHNAQVYSSGTVFHGGIAIANEKIVDVCADDYLPEAYREIDAQNRLLLPGIVDTHVHVRDPGHIERGDFESESAAAANAGVTAFLEHPISTPPPSTPEILAKRIERAKSRCIVDYAFFGAAGSEFPQEAERVAKEGIVAFKTFLHEAPEGRDEEFRGLTMPNDGGIMEGFEAVAKTGLILTVHAENNDMIKRLITKFRAEGKVGWEYHCPSRPKISEIECIEKLIRIARETGVRLAIAHISTPEAMELLKQARLAGQEVYIETCPHYLILTEDALLKYGPMAKCNPPLRSAADRDKLWKYVKDGTVDYIGSDHGSFLLAEKEKGNKDIFTAAAGSACIEMTLPLMLTAVRDGKLTLSRLMQLICENPARIFGLKSKGGLIPGKDGDFVICDTSKEFTVDHNKFLTHGRDISTWYDGMKLIGKPEMTCVRGRVVMENGIVDHGAKGWGRLIRHGK